MADAALWVVVSTDASRADLETKEALAAGTVVRFTVQHGIKDSSDTSNMAILRGAIVTPRSTLTPDSYGVQASEVVSTWELDPSVSLPAVGQIFLVAPWSIGAVESTPSAGTPAPTPAPAPDPSAPPMTAPAGATVQRPEFSAPAQSAAGATPSLPWSWTKRIVVGGVVVVAGVAAWIFFRPAAVLGLALARR